MADLFWSRLQGEADEMRSLQISGESVAWRDAVLDLHRRLRALEAEPVAAALEGPPTLMELRNAWLHSPSDVAWNAVADLVASRWPRPATESPSEPAPTPAADGDLWRVMLEAYRLGAGVRGQYFIQPLHLRGMAAEILALRDWLKLELVIGTGDPEPAFGIGAWNRWSERQSLWGRLTHEATIAQRAAEGRSDG